MTWFNKKDANKELKAVRQIIKWFEISAKDFNRATQFYSNVFGLELDIVELNGVKHGIFKLKEGQTTGAIVDNGGTKINSGVVLFFDGYPSISDLEKKIITHGGQIVLGKTLIKNKTKSGSSIIPKNFVDGSTLAYFAYFLDTEGNKMGLFGHS